MMMMMMMYLPMKCSVAPSSRSNLNTRNLIQKIDGKSLDDHHQPKSCAKTNCIVVSTREKSQSLFLSRSARDVRLLSFLFACTVHTPKSRRRQKQQKMLQKSKNPTEIWFAYITVVRQNFETKNNNQWHCSINSRSRNALEIFVFSRLEVTRTKIHRKINAKIKIIINTIRLYSGKNPLSRRKRTRFTVNSIQTVPLRKRTGDWNRKDCCERAHAWTLMMGWYIGICFSAGALHCIGGAGLMPPSPSIGRTRKTIWRKKQKKFSFKMCLGSCIHALHCSHVCAYAN